MLAYRIQGAVLEAFDHAEDLHKLKVICRLNAKRHGIAILVAAELSLLMTAHRRISNHLQKQRTTHIAHGRGRIAILVVVFFTFARHAVRILKVSLQPGHVRRFIDDAVVAVPGRTGRVRLEAGHEIAHLRAEGIHSVGIQKGRRAHHALEIADSAGGHLAEIARDPKRRLALPKNA